MAGTSLPKTRTSVRSPKMEQYYLGEKRFIVFPAVSNKLRKPEWSTALLSVTMPSGDSYDDPVEPTTIGADSQYEALVDFTETGFWEIVLTYSSDASGEELLVQKRKVRIV